MHKDTQRNYKFVLNHFISSEFNSSFLLLKQMICSFTSSWCDLVALPRFGTFIEIKIKMGKNTSISIGNYFEKFIKAEVKSGKYNSVSEVIRSALRLLEREEKKEKELIKALEVGEKSGFVEDFNPKQHLEELHKKHL